MSVNSRTGAAMQPPHLNHGVGGILGSGGPVPSPSLHLIGREATYWPVVVTTTAEPIGAIIGAEPNDGAALAVAADAAC